MRLNLKTVSVVRNHYVKKDIKLFLEPWAYEEFAQSSLWNEMRMSGNDKPLYRAVHPIVKYFVRLRYSLMQLMYDAMFENMLLGLPIARAMIITDPLDGSLHASNEAYTRHNKSWIMICSMRLY